MSTLAISRLEATVADRQILNGIDLTVNSGEVHAVMGPNGAGKSTLSAVLMGKPGYTVTAGDVTLDGRSLLGLPTWKRAEAGLHLVMQYPTEVPGVSVESALAEVAKARGETSAAGELRVALEAEAGRIGLPVALLDRALNVDLSGGEKKRNETLQLAVLRPRFVVLDELDSGLDIDALRDCSRRIEELSEEGMGVIAITHYNRLLTELRPDRVHILVKGRIVASGGPELADQLERDGYAAFAPAVDAEEAGEAHVKAQARPSSLDELFGSMS